MNAAIKEPADSKVVERTQGKEIFVLPPEEGASRQSIAFTSNIKIVPFEYFSNKPHELIEHGIIQADPVLCTKLNLE